MIAQISQRVKSALFLLVILFPALAQADTVYLKNGKTVEGDVVRKDNVQVAVLVGGQPQFFPAEDVDHIAYSRLRFSPAIPPASSKGSLSNEPVNVDIRLLRQAGSRLHTFHGVIGQIRKTLVLLKRHNDSAAAQEAQLAAQEVLPALHGRFSPLCALADLFILLGLRAPSVWLALLMVREPRSFTRIAEFLVVAYGFTMLLMTFTFGLANLWIKLFIFPFTLCSVGCLFAWMFALELRRAVFAFLLSVAINFGVEFLLVRTGLI